MLVLTCNNIEKSFGIENILKDVSFSVHSTDKIGIVGSNGSGKTTLFNILIDNIHPDGGEVYIRKGLEIGYLAQHAEVSSEVNIFEECLKVFDHLIEMEKDLRNLELIISEESQKNNSELLDKSMEEYSNLSEEFINLNGYGYESSIRGVLIGLGFDESEFEKSVEVLSGGEKSRLSLAKLLLKNPDILLLDEPTNHLDIDAINWLARYITDYNGAVLLISHDRYFLDDVSNKIFHLNNKSIDEYNTNYTNFIKRRKENLDIYKRHYENQQQEIEKHKEIIEKYKAFGGERYNRLAKSRQKMLDKIDVMDKQTEEKPVRFTFKPKVESGNDVLSVKDLSKSFSTRTLFEDIDFNIYKGERIGLIGPNGAGKSTLFKIILDQIDDFTGEVSIGHKVDIGYFDQEMADLDFNKTVIDDVWDDNPTLTYQEIRTILSQFMFLGDDIFKEISDLSGGEKGRLSILKLILSHSNFLLMDEPTNHLDIDSKEVLEDAILDYEGTIFVISHDRYFLNRVIDKILVLDSNGITEYLGNYDYYMEKINELKKPEEKAQTKTRTQIQNERRKKRNQERKLKKEKEKLKSLENEISKLEELIENYDLQLCDTEIYSDTDKVLKITMDREETEDKLNVLFEKWINKAED